ncbi:hypothetical protein ASPTUDRAFT_299615 [Aspergillus tubingensis CBS 134.48]|uniref:Uncharacterized protein n=1 Tax=Aspergillus tubingensis (strain CBS 134.48) TaxID=767770 RepID=A0A1L9NQB6_ASPTC|nr:hypothetical protein ASPTUDRAFT_299615 [Aspergillus tubingensis CBS 134.48]
MRSFRLNCTDHIVLISFCSLFPILCLHFGREMNYSPLACGLNLKQQIWGLKCPLHTHAILISHEAFSHATKGLMIGGNVPDYPHIDPRDGCTLRNGSSKRPAVWQPACNMPQPS